MKLLVISLLTVGLLALGGWFLYFSNQNRQVDYPNQKVAVTIYPLYDIVRNVSGDDMEVVLLLPPGSSPHTYEPTPQNIQNISGAKTIFVVGHGLDDWVSDLAKDAGVKRVDVVDKNIDFIVDEDVHNQAENPHYWLSLINAQIIINNIADILAQIDPDHAKDYQQNANHYISQVAALHQEASNLAQQSNTNQIATFHNAWNYLARDYGLDVVATFEPFAGEEPTPQFIKNFHDAVADNQIKVVYAEPQFSSQKMDAIANDLNVKIQYLDPLGGTIDKDTYLKTMRYNLMQLFNPPEEIS